jgi:hypothetical protein
MKFLSTLFFSRSVKSITSDYAKTVFFSVLYNSLFMNRAIIQYNIIVWYIDPLLGNDREIRNYTRVVAK